jgi:CheY-like chemotaxis protein
VLLMGRKTDRLRRAVGCPNCRDTGYRGRMVVAEVLVVTPEMQRAIARGADVPTLTELARKGGMHTLWEAGIERVLSGATSMHELLDNIGAPVDDPADQQSDVDDLLARLLPATPPPAPADAEAARGQPRPADARAFRRVLLVDDDRVARQALRDALLREGFGVIEAADGEAALAYARRLQPDFVLTEIALPRLDAVGLLQALRDDGGPAPQVFVCTTQADAELLAWVRELGALDVLAKPADAAALAARLRARQAVAA